MLVLLKASGFQCPRCGYVRYLNSKPSAMGLFLRERKLLLVSDGNDNSWDLPGGFLNNGEEPFAGLVRECQEELGVTVEEADLIDIIVDRYRDGSWSIASTYLVRNWRGEASAQSEIRLLGWFEINALPQLRYEGVGRAVKLHLGARSAR